MSIRTGHEVDIPATYSFYAILEKTGLESFAV